MRENRKTQSGFMLLEMSLALLIFTIVMAIRLKADWEADRDIRAKNVGQSVATVQAALNKTLANYYASFLAMPDGAVAPINITLSNGKSVAIADGHQPTIQNIVDLGLLPANFNPRSPTGGNYRMFISLTPVGCVAPSCNLEGIVLLDTPFTIGGIVDLSRLGLAVEAIGSDGGDTTTQNTALIKGLSGQWSTPLPSGINPTAGILAARVGSGSQMWSAFFRTDGSNAMTNDADIGNHNLKNVQEVIFSSTNQKNPNDACTSVENGALTTTLVNNVATTLVCSNLKWTPQSGLPAVPGSSCSPEGFPAVSTTTGEQLFCKNGQYVKLLSLVSKNVSVDRQIVWDTKTVAKPVCDVGGTPNYSFLTNAITVDITTAPPKQNQTLTAIDNGNSWTIVLGLKDDNGNFTSGNAYSLTEQMNIECQY